VIGLIILLALMVLVAVVGAYVAGTRRAVKSFGIPTPETAKIETEARERHLAIVNEGEKEKHEIDIANRDDLLARLRDSVRPPK